MWHKRWWSRTWKRGRTWGKMVSHKKRGSYTQNSDLSDKRWWSLVRTESFVHTIVVSHKRWWSHTTKDGLMHKIVVSHKWTMVSNNKIGLSRQVSLYTYIMNNCSLLFLLCNVLLISLISVKNHHMIFTYILILFFIFCFLNIYRYSLFTC